jgi:hypothetical protein
MLVLQKMSQTAASLESRAGGANTNRSNAPGARWAMSALALYRRTGEAAVAELSDGRVYYNSRVHWDSFVR